MKLFLNLLMCFIAYILFVISPLTYSYEFCLLIFFLYIIFNIIFLCVDDKSRKLGFEFLFMISFFMTNFIYPVFYFTDNPTVSLFQFGFNHNVISKSSALALLAYTFYILGVTNYKSAKIKKNDIVVSNSIFTVYLFLSILTFTLFLISGGLTSFKDLYSGNSVNVGFSGYFMVIFSIFTTILTVLLGFIKSRKLRLISFSYLLLIIILFLSTGARLFALGIALIIIVQISKYYKRIPLIFVLAILFLGAGFLHFIQILRELGFDGNTGNAISVLSEKSSIFDPFLDLIINNRNLFVLVDFVDTYGYVYFLNILTSIFGVFPGISFFMGFFSIPQYMASGMLPTYLQFGMGGNFGLGTNMVGEAYLSLGVLGVVFVFWGFGAFIKFINNRCNYNIYYNLIYFYLVSQAVFYPRIDYLWGLRSIIWMVLFYFIIYNLLKVRKAKK
ncbi:O-antigen polymerase [Acinetobacter johnsonii]|uniref:O-antigen polymerase n=1 Tax=Acinetobacter johnsonii TaxID=40214 RepID=UPI00102A3010|nr:O-antigen polymerase [Acinetobacter johnsonii]RZN84958.1 oligosaccharide repeat unit polymerase [Acinetobacter johnsonii]